MLAVILKFADNIINERVDCPNKSKKSGTKSGKGGFYIYIGHLALLRESARFLSFLILLVNYFSGGNYYESKHPF